MDLPILKAIAAELGELLSGGFVNQIHQPLPRELFLRIRTRGAGERKLALSADPQLGRIHTTDLKIPNPPRPPRFCAYLRAHFKGARVQRIRCDPMDRVAFIETLYGPPDNAQARHLILELLGRDSNIILVNGSDGLIMDCLHRIPEKGFDNRVVIPGALYMKPPARDKNAPSRREEARVKISPGITGVDERGKRRLTLNADPGRDQVFDSMNEAAKELYNTVISRKLMDTERRELASIVGKRIKACSKRIRKIEMDLERLEGLAEFREMGELLKANLHLAKKGQSAVVVFDWGADAQRKIPVDPSLTPVENMEKMFKKAGKSKRGLTIARQRLSEAILEKDALEDLRYLVERAGDWESLNMLGEEIRPDQQAQGKGPQKETPKQPSREKPAGYDKFPAPVAGVVYVGKTAKGNDQILRTKAKNGDIWFHVKGAAGAHAVLVNQGQGPPDPKDIEFAARLALERSKVSSDSKHEVMMADVKDVKKLKGGPAGQVRVDKYSTIQVSPQ